MEKVHVHGNTCFCAFMYLFTEKHACFGAFMYLFTEEHVVLCFHVLIYRKTCMFRVLIPNDHFFHPKGSITAGK